MLTAYDRFILGLRPYLYVPNPGAAQMDRGAAHVLSGNGQWLAGGTPTPAPGLPWGGRVAGNFRQSESDALYLPDHANHDMTAVTAIAWAYRESAITQSTWAGFVARWHEPTGERLWFLGYDGSTIRADTSPDGNFYTEPRAYSSVNPTNRWFMVASLHGGNEQTRIFIDGVERGTSPGTSGLGSKANAVYIGAVQSFGGQGTQYFSGRLGPVAVFPRRLSPLTIREIYRRGVQAEPWRAMGRLAA